jgi:hypothetical protein
MGIKKGAISIMVMGAGVTSLRSIRIALFYLIFFQELFQNLVGLGSYYRLMVDHKGWNCRYTHFVRPRPIGINGFPEGPQLESRSRLLIWKSHRFRQTNQFVDFGDILALYEISSEDRIVKFIAPVF